MGPGGELVPDVAGDLPGRGLWLTPCRKIFERAAAKRLFSRAARRPISVPAELAGRIESVLAQRCCDGIGLARRAGLAVAGFEKVRASVRAGKIALLFEALDGAQGGRGKIRALAPDLPLAAVLTAAEMVTIFGRDHVVNIAIGDSPLSSRLMTVAQKIAGFRLGAVIERVEPAPGRSARQDGGIGSR